VPSKVLRNTTWLLVGYAARMGSQALAFVLLARSLGVNSFGTLAAMLASANLIAPLVEYGAYNLVVRDIVNGVPAKRSVGIGLVMSLIALPVGLILLSVIKFILLPQISWGAVMIVGATVFFGNRMILLANGVHTAHGLLWRNAVVEIANGLSLLFIAFIFSQSELKLGDWIFWSFIQSLSIGTVALVWVSYTWGRFTFNFGGLVERGRQGVHFAVNGVATNAYVDLDKTLLARFSTLEAVSTFSAAHRLTVLANVPLAAFMGAIYPRFFAQGRKSLQDVRQFAWRVVPVTFTYGVIASLVTWLLAPTFADILGEGFAETTQAIRWLCWLIPFQCLQLPFMEALTGSGHQLTRTIGQLIALTINFVVNLILINRLGWQGAAIAALIGQVFLTAYMIAFTYRHESRNKTAYLLADELIN
jgi:O-antigen/teichoic acid export membrane protein